MSESCTNLAQEWIAQITTIVSLLWEQDSVRHTRIKTSSGTRGSKTAGGRDHAVCPGHRVIPRNILHFWALGKGFLRNF